METTEQSPYKDRSAALVTVGALLIGMGLLSLLVLSVSLLGLVLMATLGEAAGGMQMMWSMLLLYLLGGVAFIVLGVGAIRARRWAWKITLAIAWAWLFSGSSGFLMLLIMWRSLWSSMHEEGLPAVVGVVIGLAFLILYTAIPLLLILFFGSRPVQATCAHRDPRARWTDRVPTAVLVLCIFLAQLLFSMSTFWSSDFMFPFFGSFLRGPAGFLAMLLSAVLVLVLILGQCRLRPAAWWGALLFSMMLLASTWLTYWRVPPEELFAAMDFSPQQLAAVQNFSDTQVTVTLAATAGWALLLLGLQLYNKRYFASAPQAVE